MNRPKQGKGGWGKDVPIEDPAVLRDAFRLLRDQQIEFPIKVEGTSTLPYTSQVRDLNFEQQSVVLKLVRPLPHELMKGAEFRATFAVDEQRFEALIVFQERAEYLSYNFQLPSVLFYADRRAHKRYAFRPRESAFVTAQDGGIPGIGVAGPLVNIGLGGFAMRVDRVLKLDDGMRIPPAAAPLERGKSFARIRLQDLPKLPMLEVAGLVSHLSDRMGEVILGFQFSRLTDAQLQVIQESLSLRDKLLRKSSPGVRDTESLSSGYRASPAAPPPSAGGGAEAPRRETASDTSGRHQLPGSDPLSQMARRCIRLALAVGDAGHAERIQNLLRSQGFHRLERAATLEEAVALWRSADPPQALVVDMSLAGPSARDPLAALQILERQAESQGDIPLVILAEQVDDGALMSLGPRTRLLPLSPEGPDAVMAWAEAVAYAAGLMD